MVHIKFLWNICYMYTHIYIYTYIRVYTCDDLATTLFRATYLAHRDVGPRYDRQYTRTELGGGTSPTEYGIRKRWKRVSTRIRLCHGSEGGRPPSRIRSFSFSPQNFSFITRTEEGKGLSERYLERLRYRSSPIILRFRLGRSPWDDVARGNPRTVLITFDKQTRLRFLRDGILNPGQIRSMHRWVGFTMSKKTFPFCARILVYPSERGGMINGRWRRQWRKFSGINRTRSLRNYCNRASINLDRWKKARRRDLKWMELHRN